MTLLQMTSAGAMGGGVSSAVARALGAGNEAAARNLVAHALVIALGAGLLYTVLMVGLGRALYTLLRGSGAALTQALAYSDVLYLQIVAPFYPLFGAGMALYFASQGAGHVARPVLAGTVRLLIVVTGGILVLGFGGPLAVLFSVIALGIALFGGLSGLAVYRARWGR